MTDDGADVMKTFTDYVDEVPVQFIRFSLPEGTLGQGKLCVRWCCRRRPFWY